ncbi:hypothetical protein A33M_0683 [Rhodovulum sp. PH10]|uniref:hypothetical protein n=1 Tax=Rhodovulum sp. PH10 TaxID=1187851 RepID=UPI00027C2C98|nr:hypothetical protein [Rhodovulum sp. PH10]EJW09971.1 hypothetical protein A33M_0683 [Rhodovulum sp. PH10]
MGFLSDVSTALQVLLGGMAAIGGWTVLSGLFAAARKAIASWQAAANAPNPNDARLEAVEEALREMAEALDKRNAVAVADPPKGEVG